MQPGSDQIDSRQKSVGWRLLYLMGILCQPVLAQSADVQDSSPPAEKEAGPVKEETISRELEASEDPLDVKTPELQEAPFYWYKDHTSVNAYASARLRYRYVEADESGEADDGGSRLGLNGELQFRPGFWLLGRAELGFNLFDTVEYLGNASGRPSKEDVSASARLAYAGISTPSTALLYGKNWSSYYQVSGITDRFQSFGGEASGTYNALTDGGPTGTGRADAVLQGRFSIDAMSEQLGLKPFKLHVQAQQGEAIPGAEQFSYQQSFGISAILETKTEKVLGIAYNHALIDEQDLPALASLGLDGDAQALVIGTRRFDDNYYAGMTISALRNHETTDEGIYFDGWGWEGFGSYQFVDRWWAVGGWNWLEPKHGEEQAETFRLRYGVLGLRYTFDGFKKMIFSEIRLDDSRSADGGRLGNIFTFGVRWDFSRAATR